MSWHSSSRQHYPLRDESEANARLIAAATELLKELERQIEWTWNPFEPKNQSDQYKRMKALFDRVTGESHG